MGIGRTLRRAVMDRVIAQVPVLGGRVYDRAVEGVALPYVTLGPSYWVDDSAECIDGRAWAVQVDIWDAETNKGALEDITDAVAAALRGFAVPTLAAHPAQLRLVRVLDDPDGRHVHGVVQVEIEVED